MSDIRYLTSADIRYTIFSIALYQPISDISKFEICNRYDIRYLKKADIYRYPIYRKTDMPPLFDTSLHGSTNKYMYFTSCTHSCTFSTPPIVITIHKCLKVFAFPFSVLGVTFLWTLWLTSHESNVLSNCFQL